MGISLRHYLFPEEGEPQRLPNRLVDGLISGEDSLPDYAGTRQRVMSVALENEEGQPGRIIRTEGSIWVFDDDGKIRKGLQKAFAEVMNSLPTPGSDSETVIHLQPRLSRKRLDAEYRWEPKTPDINRVINDLWPKGKEGRLKAAKGTAAKRPPLTFAARHALEEASQSFWKIANAIDDLKEPALKGFAFEARSRSAAESGHGYLYRAIAEMAEMRLEILRRRRTGTGTWYALVEVVRWDVEHVGNSVAAYHERCEGKRAAEEAARRLLIEHAGKFAENISIEAEVLTDLEWRDQER
jgi:hypothetical protein